VTDGLTLPSPCLVVLVGPGASGKTTWAAANFPADEIVSSDRLRAVVGAGEDDVTASTDAFVLLEEIVRLRVGRGLTTVVDTLGLDAGRRAAWLVLARGRGMACVAVAFDTAPAECRARNHLRTKRIPADALAGQLRTWAVTREVLPTEGYDRVLTPTPVRVVPEAFVAAPAAARRQQEQPLGLRFGLQVGEFAAPGGKEATARWLREVAAGAESADFDAVYVMDHFRQIPQVGRAWDDLLESYTTLAYLAACTERVRLGALVTGITYRNVAHLGKIVATLDVLSGGRAVCGLGLAWFEAEHRAYGWEFPSTADRYALLEDALQLLPLLWGPGSPPFRGKVLDVPEAVGYPRPVQEHVPMIVGGGGERRTLRLAARYADAANVFGDAATVAHKVAVLRRHCADADRGPADVAMTHLSTTLVGAHASHVAELVEARRPRNRSAATYAARVNAGTIEDQVGRFRELAEAGASEVVVRLPDLSDPTSLERMAAVIAAFR
jgi:F420-dependent oxidoreductase-like protein